MFCSDEVRPFSIFDHNCYAIQCSFYLFTPFYIPTSSLTFFPPAHSNNKIALCKKKWAFCMRARFVWILNTKHTISNWQEEVPHPSCNITHYPLCAKKSQTYWKGTLIVTKYFVTFHTKLMQFSHDTQSQYKNSF